MDETEETQGTRTNLCWELKRPSAPGYPTGEHFKQSFNFFLYLNWSSEKKPFKEPQNESSQVPGILRNRVTKEHDELVFPLSYKQNFITSSYLLIMVQICKCQLTFWPPS